MWLRMTAQRETPSGVSKLVCDSLEIATMSKGQLRVQLFGTPRVFVGDAAVQLQGPPGTLRLLALLLLKPADGIDRADAAASLWPDCTDDASRANLRRHIAYLDHALSLAGCNARVMRWGSAIGLDPREAIGTDVEAFEEAAQSGRYEEAALLYGGELLATFTDEWITGERERLRKLHVENLARLVEELEITGDPKRALEWATELRRADRWREESVRTVMTLRRETGDRIGALREYREFRDGVREAFSAEPSDATQALFHEIADERETQKHPVVLPAEITTFFGREDDIETIRSLLERKRLVVLVGPPGVGKTRLAVRAGRDLDQRYEDGVWFVELAALDDPHLLEQRITETLDRGGAQRGPSNTLELRLQDKRALLILDNAEHLLQCVGERAAALLRALPELRILVTSRAPLGVDIETVHPVRPLELPRPGASVREIASNTAVRLFLDRAAAAMGGSSTDGLPVSEVAEICRRLDGLPLAIEFAAVRLRGMTIRQVRAGLDSRFELLSQERHTAMEQHRTLYASFEWSHRLLSPQERATFRALSVFRGGWSADAAAEVARGGVDAARTARELLALCDNSLVVAPSPAMTEPRYDFLESIRAFAGEQLRLYPSERDTALDRHARYFANRFITHDEDLRRARAHEYFDEVEREHDNVRAALAYLIGDGHDPMLGVRLALAVSRYWFDRGYTAEGAHWIEAGLKCTEIQGNVRAQALLCLATITRNAGDYEKAYGQFMESLTLLRSGAERHDVIKALLQLSNVARMLGSFGEAIGHAAEALELCEPSADEYFAGFARAALGCIHLAAGEIEAARRFFTASLEAFDAAGARGDAALVVNNLGLCALYEGDLEVASALCRQALERSRLARYDFSVTHTLHSLAMISARSGRAHEARNYLERALALARRLEDCELCLMCIEVAAEIAYSTGATEQAAKFLSAADRGRARFHALRAPIESRFADDFKRRVIERLPAHAYSPMEAIGALLTLEDALDEVQSFLSSLREFESVGQA